MKATKKHLQAVYERLTEYELTILSGKNAFGECSVCQTTNKEKTFRNRQCGKCVLGGISNSNIYAACVSDLRSLAKITTLSSSCLVVDPIRVSKPKIKARYEEILEHLNKQGY